MTESTVTFAFIIGALCGALVMAIWLGSALARVTTDRNRLQVVVDGLREQLCSERKDSDMLYRKVADLTLESVELLDAANKAQENAEGWRRKAEGATGDWM